MTSLNPIKAADLKRRLDGGDTVLIDVRETDEHAREHILGARLAPLSAIDAHDFDRDHAKAAVFHCKSGMRTNTNCARLATNVEGPAFMLEGGLDAWKRAGLSVRKKPGAPIELMRQVQIVIGLFVLTGIALSLTVHPGFIAIPAFMGAGLTFAGLSGWCGMAKLIALAPWNRQAA